MRTLLICAGLLSVVASGAQSLIPLPAEVAYRSGGFTFNADTRLDADDAAWPVGQELAQLAGEKNGFMPANGRTHNVVSLRLDEARQDLGEEGYTLEVTRQAIRIVARRPAGLFYGVQTVRQLVPAGGGRFVRGISVTDVPRFPWRGLHLDVSRHFFSVATIKKTLDLMALLKLNRFHWHLTDDGGWRMESKKFPKLTKVGAFRVDTGEMWNARTLEFPGQHAGKKLYGGYYTQDDIREIVVYARERNITVVPEIELPGHSMAALSAYPDLICEISEPGGFQRRSPYPHPNVFCAGKEQVFAFFEQVLDETMALFPSEYIHIGGDEVDKYLWSQCASCQKRMRDEGLRDLQELQSYFIKRIGAHIASKGRKMIGWDEILEGGLAPGAAVMSWRGFDGGIEAAKQGHSVVMSPTSHCYFDYSYTTTPTSKVYTFEPIPEGLGARPPILGGQANVWTEWLDTPEKIELMMLPRLLALAEAVWTTPARKDFASFTRRLGDWYTRFDRLGYAYYVEPPEPEATLAVFRRSAALPLPRPVPGWAIRYTVDGTNPTPNSPLMPSRYRFDRDIELRMATFTPGGKRSDVVTVRGVRSDGIGIQVEGYRVRSYKGNWARLPDFDRLTPESEGQADLVDVPNDGTEQFGAVFSGMFHAPESGFYTFTLGSDDGSALFLAGAPAILHDGLHGYEERTAKVWLDAGSYPLEVRYFQAGGAARLALFAEGPGLPRRRL